MCNDLIVFSGIFFELCSLNVDHEHDVWQTNGDSCHICWIAVISRVCLSVSMVKVGNTACRVNAM